VLERHVQEGALVRVERAFEPALDPIDVVLVPVGDPPHRDAPQASAADRVAMLRLALPEFPRLGLDTREIGRVGKSYTVDTLRELRGASPGRSLLLIVGADAFVGLPRWHQWTALFELAHVLVVPRPGVELDGQMPAPLAAQWTARVTTDAGDLRTRPAGAIYVQSVTATPISSTAVRAMLAGGSARPAGLAGLLPAAVLAYIDSNRLYKQPR
jgi:nicotinate-nucleotide adenylyltransferase